MHACMHTYISPSPPWSTGGDQPLYPGGGEAPDTQRAADAAAEGHGDDLAALRGGFVVMVVIHGNTIYDIYIYRYL